MKTSIKIVIAVVSVAVVAGGAVGTYFIVKNINDENHKKDIEMAVDCAMTFEMPSTKNTSSSGFVEALNQVNTYSTEAANNRRAKRQECAEKYHVTHQEIIDKIGTEIYWPK